MLYHLIKPDQKIDQNDIVPIELIDKREIIEKILTMQKQETQEKTDIISLNGRTLDTPLLKSEQARQLTKKEYRKEFDRKKKIDLRNEKRPE